jgi:hypothetical protein
MRFGLLLALTCSIATTAIVRAQEIPTTPIPEQQRAVRLPGTAQEQLDAVSRQFTAGHWKRFVAGATTLVDTIPACPQADSTQAETLARQAPPNGTALQDSAKALLDTLSKCGFDDGELKKARQLVRDSQWKEFAVEARVLAGMMPKDRIALKRDYVLFVWPDTLPAADKPVLLSAVLHDPSGDPYARVIPGLKNETPPRFFEVFVTDNPKASIASYYISKPLADPLLAQVPDVVDKFLGPLFTRIEANLSHALIPTAAPAKAGELWAVVREVRLPESRAGVEVKLSASLPASATDALDTLAADLERRGYSNTPEQTTAFDAARSKMKAAADNPVCDGAPRACRNELHKAVTDAIGPELRKPLSDSDREAVRSLETALHTAIDELTPDVVAGELALDNSPLTHLGFGLLSAFIAHSYGDDPRAKIDSNKVTADPLGRALQLVVLNWSPWGYQEKTTRRWSPRAFVRLFGGVVFSPDVGIGAGASFMVLSNLGVNVGYAHLFISKPEDGLQIGDDLSEKLTDGTFKFSDQLRRDPLRTGRRDALFVGVSYNFK